MILLSFMNCKVFKCQSEISKIDLIWLSTILPNGSGFQLSTIHISSVVIVPLVFAKSFFLYFHFFCSNSLKYAQIERNEGTLASSNIYPKHISSCKIWICMCGKTCDYADDFKRCYSGLFNMLSTVCSLYSQSTVTATVHRRC